MHASKIIPQSKSVQSSLPQEIQGNISAKSESEVREAILVECLGIYMFSKWLSLMLMVEIR